MEKEKPVENSFENIPQYILSDMCIKQIIYKLLRFNSIECQILNIGEDLTKIYRIDNKIIFIHLIYIYMYVYVLYYKIKFSNSTFFFTAKKEMQIHSLLIA
jgi:hypothetical protein